MAEQGSSKFKTKPGKEQQEGQREGQEEGETKKGDGVKGIIKK